MGLEGYAVESREVHGKAFTSYLRFPGLLHDLGLSGHRQEKVLVKLNAEPRASITGPTSSYSTASTYSLE